MTACCASASLSVLSFTLRTAQPSWWLCFHSGTWSWKSSETVPRGAQLDLVNLNPPCCPHVSEKRTLLSSASEMWALYVIATEKLIDTECLCPSHCKINSELFSEYQDSSFLHKLKFMWKYIMARLKVWDTTEFEKPIGDHNGVLI